MKESVQKQKQSPLNLTSLNHISLVCRSLKKTLDFYQNVLGFIPIRRPDFDFDGAWLFNYGIGVHLLQSEKPESMPEIGKIDIKANHISFQCESMSNAEKKLKEMEIEYVKSRVEESGIFVDQLFFHDPDGIMIEICNCDNLPVIPITGGGADMEAQSCSALSCKIVRQQQHQIEEQIQKNRSLTRFPSMGRA